MSLETLAESIRSHRGALVMRVVDEMYADPFWTERYGKRGRIHSEQDLAYHVDYLVQALVARDPEVLAHYSRWLQSVLTTRGMCTHHLDESFDRLARAIHFFIGAESTVDIYLARARSALLYGLPQARAFQNRSAMLVLATRAVAPPELTPEHVEGGLSFLADALALGSEASLQSYLAWMRESFAKRGIDSAVVTRFVEVVDRVLDGDSELPTPVRTLARELLARAAGSQRAA